MMIIFIISFRNTKDSFLSSEKWNEVPRFELVLLHRSWICTFFRAQKGQELIF